MTIQTFKKEFDTHFLTTVQTWLNETKNRISDPQLSEIIDHALLVAANGKRIRPYAAALAYQQETKKPWENIVFQLIGIELIHTMALIHDDVMDQAETRHGVATLHEFTKTEMGDNTHHGYSQAILIGDLFFSFAHRAFFTGSINTAAQHEFHLLIEEVVAGQMLDVATPLYTNVSEAYVEDKMLLKTARYTFTRPLRIGALLGGNNTEWYETYGDALGLAFQVKDDLDDIYIEQKDAQKPFGKDISNRQHTLISIHTQTSPTHGALFNDYFGKDTLPEQHTIMQHITESGAREKAVRYIENHCAIAAQALTAIPEEDQSPFLELITLVKNAYAR